MKILYITAGQKNIYLNDYMSDLLLHGLRNLFGENVIDYPGSWYMYKDESNKRSLNKMEKLWGKGFTTSNLLNKYDKIDRADILNKIKKKYFDLIIFSAVRRSKTFLEEVIKYNNNFIFVDGEDDNYIEKKLSQKSIYFKRELVEKKNGIEPINFAVPKEKIIKKPLMNTQFFLAPLIPGKMNTYIYEREDDYYNMYRNSLFGLTYKKAGWDCLRHYEILMNGCIPFFLDLRNCPKYSLISFPKKKIELLNTRYMELLSFYNPFKIYKKKFLTIDRIFSYMKSIFKKKNFEDVMSNSQLYEERVELLNYTNKYLTTDNLAKSILSLIKSKN